MARRSKTAGITTDSAGNKTIDKICFKERVFVGLTPSRSSKPRNTLPRVSRQSAAESYTESVLRRLSEKQRSGI